MKFKTFKMKKLFTLYIVFIAIAISFTSCKDKLDLTSGAKESAVVVGVLDKSESAHFIKVTRTFIGDGVTSAVDIAQIPDSSYFDNVEIKVEETFVNGSTGRTWTLHDTIIQNKSEGVFYGPQQKVYVFYTSENQPLKDDGVYKLTVNIDNGRILVTGKTTIVSGITLGAWANNNGTIRLTGTGANLGVYATENINVTNVGTAYKLNAKVRFDYREFTPGLIDSTDHSILFNLGEAQVTPGSNSSHSFSFVGETFYQTLKEKIPVSTMVERRNHLGFNITITGASRELTNYIEVNKPASSLSQNKPTYTNLTITKGHSVIGIFGSRLSVTKYKVSSGTYLFEQALDKKSRKELCIGPLTGPLGFCSTHPNDNAPVQETWYCH